MSTPSIKNRYDGQPEGEDFFSLVRHYENHYLRNCKAKQLDATKLGEDGSPKQEALRFKSISSMGFSLDKVKRLNTNNDNYPDQYEFLVSFIGLLGSSGVLPQHYIKLSLERIKHGDFALSEFISLFEHRLISLYFKALGKYKLPVQYEDTGGDECDNFSRSLKSFSGFSSVNKAHLFYAGHYARKNRPLSNLKSLVKELVSADVSAESMVGNWLPILPRDRCQIGVGGSNHRLGSGIILGKRYWDIQSKIVIRLHNINMKTFMDLQTDKPLYQLLASAVNAYVPLHITVCFEFHVRCHQQEMNEIGKGFQLSSNAWLMSKPKNILVSKRILIRK